MNYALKISGGDVEFLRLLQAENGAWTHDLIHKIKYKREGKWYADVSYCGISSFYFPNEARLAVNGDWRVGINICYDLYNRKTKFYGWEHRAERSKNLIIKCENE